MARRFQVGDKKSAALAILAHIDTVGAGNMPDPFTPRESDGRLYGRGALDIKSGVAAMCAAAIAARDAGAIKKPLLIAAVVDEECDSIGTEALLRRYTADAAIVLEPTDLRLTIAHKGYAWFEIVTHGRAAHGSLPSEGRDAIRMMGRVLNILDALDRKLATVAPHPILGHGSLHASLIRGGQELSSYPAECRLHLERRTLPIESAAEFEVELRTLVTGLAARDPEFRATVRGLGSRPAYEISPTAPIVNRVSAAIGKVLDPVAASSLPEWLRGLTLHFLLLLEFLESYSAPAGAACTAKRSMWSLIPSFSAANSARNDHDQLALVAAQTSRNL